MEPDSSTDLSAGGAGHHSSQEQQQQLPVNQAGKQLPVNQAGKQLPEQQQQEDDDELEREQEKMFHNSRHFAQVPFQIWESFGRAVRESDFCSLYTKIVMTKMIRLTNSPNEFYAFGKYC